MGKATADIEEGVVKTKQKTRRTDDENPPVPTFGQALELMLASKSNPNRSEVSGKRAMADTMVRDYRGSFNKHFARWADLPIDELPIFEMSNHLDALQ